MNKKILGIISILFLIFSISFIWYSMSSYSSYTYTGTSMLPTLKDNTKILVDEKYYKKNPVERGDLIVFYFDKTNTHTKRVVGLPNEKVQIKNGNIYIDDKPIESEFIFLEIYASGNLQSKGIVLGENEYFIVGDNPPFSRDSREFGPIKKEVIVGKVIKTK